MRDATLRAAGYNILDMDPEVAELDFFTDALERSAVEAVRNAEAHAVLAGGPHPDLAGMFRTLCGETRLAFLTKGRAAEVALVDALGLTKPLVLTHGLFSSTARALARCQAVIEQVPTTGPGTANLDLDQLRARLVPGALVWIEVANNGLQGWPLTVDHVERVRELCDAHDAKLVLDATRVLANSVLGGDAPFEGARRMLALTDAFTISCAKELLSPVGAIVGARDLELIGRVSASALSVGTSLDRTSAQIALAEGFNYVAAHPDIIAARNAKAMRLVDLLERARVPVLTPCGGWAVFVELRGIVMRGFDVPHIFSLLSHLYAVSGVRAQILPRGDNPPYVRLALPLERFADADLEAAATGVARFMATIDQAPVLRPAAAQQHLTPLHRRYEVSG